MAGAVSGKWPVCMRKQSIYWKLSADLIPMENNQLLHQLTLIFTNTNSLFKKMPAVLLLHSRSSSFSQGSGSFDKLVQRHKGRYWSNNPLDFWRGGGGMLWYNVGFLSGKKLHAAPHSHAETHVSTIKDTHSPLPQWSVWLCHHPNLLHKHTSTNTKTHSYTHTKSGQHVQAGQPKPLCPGEGVVTVCVYVCLMGSN